MRAHGEARKPVNSILLRLSLLLFLAVLVTLLAFPRVLPREVSIEVGEVAARDIKADRDLMVFDQAATNAKRLAAEHEYFLVLDFDDQSAVRARQVIGNLFNAGRNIFIKEPEEGLAVDPKPEKKTAADNGELAKLYETTFGLKPTGKTFKRLKQMKFSVQAEEILGLIVVDILEKGLLTDQALRSLNGEKGIVLRHIFSKREETLPNTSFFYTKRQARETIMARTLYYRSEMKAGWTQALVTAANALVEPNVSLNVSETELRKAEAVSEVSPVFFQVKRGEMIVREGAKVDVTARQKLETQARSRGELNGILSVLGVFILSLAAISFIYRAGRKSFDQVRIKDKDLVFLALLMVISLLLVASASMVSETMARFGGMGLGENTLLFLVPLTAAGMLTAIFLGAAPAFLFTMIMSILTGILMDSFVLAIYYFIGGVVGSAGVVKLNDRGSIIRAGSLVGLVNAAVLLGLALYHETFMSMLTAFNITAGLLNGLLAGIVVTGLIPLFEILFRYTTNIKLLELSHLDRPILRELMVQAPGTYHHSVIVGALVEAAAKAIEANHLLAKVSAHYHDLGKLKKPFYFVENQGMRENKHEKLAPSMSGLILTAHVKDGVELARQNRLSQDIVDIIQQHHGTTLISYFYQKAVDAQNGDHPQVNDEDYRYGGPKPQTKEAGIVLLADCVEAASRTLVDPTPSRIQGMVQKIINNIFSDGQLDECELALKDLHLIAKSFNQILVGIFHRRIEYPDQAGKENNHRSKNANGNRHKHQAEDNSDPDQDPQGTHQEDLKRLGM